MNMAVSQSEPRGQRFLLSDSELATVSAICNRISRMLGLTDRDGLRDDIAIVQAHCPLNLEALLIARDHVFVEELLNIVDATDRTTGSLKGGFQSRFMVERSNWSL